MDFIAATQAVGGLVFLIIHHLGKVLFEVNCYEIPISFNFFEACNSQTWKKLKAVQAVLADILLKIPLF